MELEYKAGATEFKAGAADGEYEGYFAVTGNVDDGGDVLEPGAFKKTLAERGGRVRVFWGHDPLRPLGPPPAQIVEDARGLYVQGRLSVDSFWGREAWTLLKDGALSEGSIGYLSIPARTEWKEGRRHLFEVKLFEVSFVALGMNPETRLQALKSLGWDMPGAMQSYLEVLQRVVAGLKGAALPGAAEPGRRDARAALLDALAVLDAFDVAAAPVRIVDHAALQMRLRAAELALAGTN